MVMPVFFSKKQAVAWVTSILTTIAALVAAVVVGFTQDPKVVEQARKVVTCQSVEQLLRQYAKDAGSSFDAVKCVTITPTDLTHWVAIVDIKIAGITKQWTISISTDGVQIKAAAPLAVPSS